jgi:hypothetical protein
VQRGDAGKSGLLMQTVLAFDKGEFEGSIYIRKSLLRIQ